MYLHAQPYSVQTVAPTRLPLDLDDCKQHLRVTHSREDSLINSYLALATEWLQKLTGLQLITATRRIDAYAMPTRFCIRPPERPPLLTVSSLTYLDTGGTRQTVSASDYEVDTTRWNVEPAYNVTWPTARSQWDSVQLTYTCGHGTTPADVPETLKHALRLLLSVQYEYRLPLSETSLAKVGFSLDALVELDSLKQY